jgi:hypothetical protein
MGRWAPCKRRDFINKLKKLGFSSPEAGGRHFYMRYGIFTLILPHNTEYSIPQIKMLLKEIELGLKKKIPLEEWEKL